jgi:hypothetical protein
MHNQDAIIILTRREPGNALDGGMRKEARKHECIQERTFTWSWLNGNTDGQNGTAEQTTRTYADWLPLVGQT